MVSPRIKSLLARVKALENEIKDTTDTTTEDVDGDVTTEEDTETTDVPDDTDSDTIADDDSPTDIPTDDVSGGDDDMDADAAPDVDADAGDTTGGDPDTENTPLGQQALSRMYEHAGILMTEYDDILGVLENPNVKTKMQEVLEHLEGLMSDIEDLYSTEYPDAAPLEGGGSDMEGDPGVEETETPAPDTEGDEDEKDLSPTVPADSGGADDTNVSGSDAVEGMQTKSMKQNKKKSIATSKAGQLPKKKDSPLEKDVSNDSDFDATADFIRVGGKMYQRISVKDIVLPTRKDSPLESELQSDKDAKFKPDFISEGGVKFMNINGQLYEYVGKKDMGSAEVEPKTVSNKKPKASQIPTAKLVQWPPKEQSPIERDIAEDGSFNMENSPPKITGAKPAGGKVVDVVAKALKASKLPSSSSVTLPEKSDSPMQQKLANDGDFDATPDFVNVGGKMYRKIPHIKSIPGSDQWQKEESMEPEHKDAMATGLDADSGGYGAGASTDHPTDQSMMGTPDMKELGGACECQDPQCPSCQGQCSGQGTVTVVNPSMPDQGPMSMCDGCSQDALANGFQPAPDAGGGMPAPEEAVEVGAIKDANDMDADSYQTKEDSYAVMDDQGEKMAEMGAESDEDAMAKALKAYGPNVKIKKIGSSVLVKMKSLPREFLRDLSDAAMSCKDLELAPNVSLDMRAKSAGWHKEIDDMKDSKLDTKCMGSKGKDDEVPFTGDEMKTLAKAAQFFKDLSLDTALSTHQNQAATKHYKALSVFTKVETKAMDEDKDTDPDTKRLKKSFADQQKQMESLNKSLEKLASMI